MAGEVFLEGLTEPQRAAVMHGEGPLLVLAGPGSGKTRVITHRAGYLAATVTAPHHILAITFTNKAAAEMASRMERLGVAGVTCCTFHALCARLLHIHAEAAGLQPDFSIFDEADQQAAMKEAARRAKLSPDQFPPRAMLAVVSRAKNDMCGPEAFRAQARGWQDRKVADLYAAYEAVLAEQNALDFDDLLIRLAVLLRDQPDLRDRIEERYPYVLVDEYQDTNHPQFLIASGLARNRRNLCVTGDPDQSIYGWRGADLNNILEFEAHYPEARVVRLEQNYRSTPQVLAAADALIRHNHLRKHKALWTRNADGPPVRVVECGDSHLEAQHVAQQIRRRADEGGRYGDVAVFYRINALSRSIEGALRDHGIPYQVARGVAFFQRKEVKDILAYLKAAVNPQDAVSLERIINVPSRGIGRTTVERIRQHAARTNRSPMQVLAEAGGIPGVSRAVRALKSFATLMGDLRATVNHGTARDAVEFVVRHSGLVAMWSAENDEDALANADELVTAAAEYDRQHAEGGGSVGEWLRQISLISDVDVIDETRGAVSLMTMHAAKGLEFDAVFMIGMEEGLMPHERSVVERLDVEEERRLCFVGMTRARRRLWLTWAKWREVRGISLRRGKSPFLHELPPDGVEWIEVGTGDRSGYDTGDGEADVPASPEDFVEWRQGQRVRHPVFGDGELLWIRPAGGRTHAGIRFDEHGEKTLVLEYASLEPIDGNDGDF